MKKFLPFFIAAVIISVSFCSNASALAETPGYARVLKDGVIFYKTAEATQNDAVFTLTKSYYIYIIDVNTVSDCYSVKYKDNENGYITLSGYVKKEDVTLIPSSQTPSPVEPVITAKALLSSKVYQKPDKTSGLCGGVIIDQSFYCYGSLYNREEDCYYYCVKFLDTIGYIQSSALEVTLPGLHPDPMPTPTPPPVHETEGTPKPSAPAAGNNGGITGTDNTLQILLIAAICIPAIIIVYLMFKPSKKVRHNYRKFYEDDDDG